MGVARCRTTAEPRLVTRIGDHVLDLHALPVRSGGDAADPELSARVAQPAARRRTRHVGRDPHEADRPRHRPSPPDAGRRPHLVPLATRQMLLPFEVADYVDFYSSEQHARNVGAIFRPDSPDLPENWKHLPIGYHGRAGTVVVSGTEIVRPAGQRKPRAAAEPVVRTSSRRLDIEAEVGFVVGTPTALGSSVRPARLRPTTSSGSSSSTTGRLATSRRGSTCHSGRSSASRSPRPSRRGSCRSTPSEAARRPLGEQDPPVFDYLRDDDPWCLDLRLSVSLNGSVVSEPPFATQYWSPGQQSLCRLRTFA